MSKFQVIRELLHLQPSEPLKDNKETLKELKKLRRSLQNLPLLTNTVLLSIKDQNIKQIGIKYG